MSAGTRPVVYLSATPDGVGAENVRRVEVYQGQSGLWHYRVRSLNGQAIGLSAEGYARKDGALRAARREHPPRPRIR